MLWTIVWFAAAALLVLIDQITKQLAVEYLLDGSFCVIPNILHFSYVENDGMAMGLLGEQRWIFMTLSTVAIAGLIVYMIGWRPKSQYVCASLALIIGGGVGNMIDRFCYVGILHDTLGEKVVRDFIDFRGFGDLWPWVFNVADSCVCIGGAMLFLWCVVSIIKEEKAERLAKAAEKASYDKVENKEDSEGEEGPKE